MGEDNRRNDLGNLIRIDDERVREHLGQIVRGTVEETLNALLEAEADRLGLSLHGHCRPSSSPIWPRSLACISL